MTGDGVGELRFIWINQPFNVDDMDVHPFICHVATRKRNSARRAVVKQAISSNESANKGQHPHVTEIWSRNH